MSQLAAVVIVPMIPTVQGDVVEGDRLTLVRGEASLFVILRIDKVENNEMTMKTVIITITGSLISAIALLPTIGLAQEVPTTLRQEIPYSQARQILIDAGWQAVLLSPNREQYAPLDYLIGELGYGEVVDCSGTGMGFCRFEFVDATGRILVVVTVNNQRGQEPTLYRWSIEQ